MWKLSKKKILSSKNYLEPIEIFIPFLSKIQKILLITEANCTTEKNLVSLVFLLNYKMSFDTTIDRKIMLSKL